MSARAQRDRTLLKKLVRPEFAGLAMRVIQAGAAFVTGVVLARVLGPEALGLYAAVLAWVMLLVSISQAGLTPLLVREVAAERQAGRPGRIHGLLRLALGLVTCASAMACLVLLTLLWAQVLPPGSQALVIIGLGIVFLNALAFVMEAALRGLGKTLMGQAPQLLVRPIVHAVLVFGLALFVTEKLSPRAAMALLAVAVLAEFTFAALALWHHARPARQAPVETDLPKWMTALVPLTLVGVLGAFSAQIGFITLGLWSTTSEVAAFRVAAQLTTLAMFGYAAVVAQNSPRFSALHTAGDPNAYARAAASAARMSFGLSLPAALVLAVFGQDILNLVFGSTYAPAYPTLLALCAQVIALAGLGVAIPVLVAARQDTWLVAVQCAGQALHLGLLAYWIPTHGAAGAAWALAIATVAIHGSLVALARVKLGFWVLPLWPDRSKSS